MRLVDGMGAGLRLCIGRGRRGERPQLQRQQSHARLTSTRTGERQQRRQNPAALCCIGPGPGSGGRHWIAKRLIRRIRDERCALLRAWGLARASPRRGVAAQRGVAQRKPGKGHDPFRAP
eukprot:354335-Chlamydomonas_euryale.AAC.3